MNTSFLAKDERIGLVAGSGRFPILFARAARAQGYVVDCLGVSGMADEEGLTEVCDAYTSLSIARVGSAIRHFQRAGVSRGVMAGKIDKKLYFENNALWHLWAFLPDWRTIQLYLRMRTSRKNDDTVLLAIVREFASDGIHFESALKFCPELLVSHGFLTKRHPSPTQWKDIRYGWELAKRMGDLDVGQTVIVNDMAVMAVEAIEGTDEAIRRAGTLCRRGGFTVVKVEKPEQDARFDVPTIGVDTIKTMSEAGGRVLAIEAGKTILLDEPEVLRLANRFGIAIVSLNAEELELRAAG